MAWTKTSVGKYIVLEESGLTLADNADSGEEYVTVSSVIPAVDYNFENAKFPIVCEITTASGALSTCDAKLQVSTGSAVTGDVMGTDSSETPLWADAASIDINIASNAVASYSQTVDATDVYAPYARIAIKTGSGDLTDAAGRVTIKLALPA